MDLDILILVHDSTQCLEHIEKHVGAASALVDVILGDATVSEKFKAIEELKLEFEIIKGDTERALGCFGDV